VNCADAYVGQNTRIRDTLNNLILNSPQTWQTSVGLPYFQIQGTVRANTLHIRIPHANLALT
jgi:hypothetical protein